MSKGILLAAIFSALLFFGCLGGGTQPKQGGLENATATPTVTPLPTPTKSPLEQLIEERLAIESQKKTRPDYPGIPKDLVFKNLPSFPSDFYKVRTLVTYGKLFDLETLEEKYWKQPEFYPMFEEVGVRLMADPPRDRWGAFGFGAYPADTQLQVIRGGNFTVSTFFHTSWLVETYQGMQVTADYAETNDVPNVNMNGSNTIKQDVEKARKYINVTFSPQMFLIEPAFPIFGANWTARVKIHGEVSKDAEPGFYVIGVNPVGPPQEYIERWTRQYLTAYTSAGGVGVGRPYYRIVVEVV